MIFDKEDSIQREVFIWRTATIILALLFCGALIAASFKRHEVVVISGEGDVLTVRRGDLGLAAAKSAQLFAQLILSYTPNEADLQERVQRAAELCNPVGRNAFLLWVDSIEYVRSAMQAGEAQVFSMTGRPQVQRDGNGFRVLINGSVRVYKQGNAPKDMAWEVYTGFVVDESNQPKIQAFDLRPVRQQ